MMVMHKKQVIVVLAVVLGMVLSACSSIGGSPTVAQLLQNSFNAMKTLNAVHVDMKLASGVTFGASTTTTGSNAAHPITFNARANGDVVKPDKDIIHLDAGQGYTLTEITLSKQVYYQNAKGQWYVIDTSKFKGSQQNPFASMNAANYNNLLAVAQKATLTDHGDQTLNGQSLRHITVTFGKNALKDLLNATGLYNRLPVAQQQNVDKVLNNITLVNPTLDLWIDEATAYVHRMELKFMMNVNLGALKIPTSTSYTLPSNLSTTVDTVIDYSKFNESITISPPANAIPVSSFGNS